MGIPWENHRVQDCPTILSSRVPFCQEEKKILCESDWYWRSSTLASDQISYHDWATNVTGFSIEPDCDIFDRCERLIFSYYTDKNCPYRSELQFWSQINITLYEIGFALRRFFMKTIMKISNGNIFSDPKIKLLYVFFSSLRGISWSTTIVCIRMQF